MQTKKPFNRFLQDGTSASIRSLQTSIEIKLSKSMERTSGRLVQSILVRQLRRCDRERAFFRIITVIMSFKASFHLTISMREQRATGKIQRNTLPSRELRPS